MTRERKIAIAGAAFIVVAAVALSSVNYLTGTAFWALIGVGVACFVIGVCLYGLSIWRQEGGEMTLERRYHVIAITLIVLGIVAGGVSWVLEGTPFWVTVGVGLALVIVGLFFAARATTEERKRKEGLE